MKAEDDSSDGIRLSGGRRERQRQRTRSRIIRAARALFARKGFAATTTQEIAIKADIGTGTLFNYASTKEDLLLLVFREEMDVVVADAFATLPPKCCLIDQLLHVFDSMVAYHKRDVSIAHALIMQLSAVNSAERRQDISVFMRDLIDRIAELLKAAQQRGELRRALPRRLLAHNLFSIYYRLLQAWLSQYISYEQYAARIKPALELQLDGLRVQSARPGTQRSSNARPKSLTRGSAAKTAAPA
ncbi:MAG: TetR/AcrR family transcriptional regulator [Candidatus Binataceae bacterium]